MQHSNLCNGQLSSCLSASEYNLKPIIAPINYNISKQSTLHTSRFTQQHYQVRNDTADDLKQFADEVHLLEFVNKVLGDVECNRPHQQHVLLTVDYCAVSYKSNNNRRRDNKHIFTGEDYRH